MIDKVDIKKDILIRLSNRQFIVKDLTEVINTNFWNRFHTDEYMITVNILNPFKRIIKFYKDENDSRFKEIKYTDMNQLEKDAFDEFIVSLETAL